MTELDAEQREIVAAVRAFVDRDVIPVASDLEHRDEFPADLVATMREACARAARSPATRAAARSGDRPVS